MKFEKILVAEDEKPIRTYIEKKLAKLGYTVIAVADGQQALEKALSNLPDIILLDVKMPVLNGLDVCKRLKAEDQTKKIPIIMLSAKAQAKEIEEGYKAGADKYLCKPIGFPDILKEIETFES